jgi:signal transduction histidine kinase
MVDEVFAQLQNEWPGVNIQLQREGLVTLQADYDQFFLLFHQLLTNAVQFRKAGVEAIIRISVDTIQMNQFRTMEEKYHYVDFIRIRLQDEGIGFASEFKGQVFELFRRLHANSGRGVGLSLCKKIVETHGGSISIDSVKDAGTTVTILLPASVEPDESQNLLKKTDFTINANQ